jgi:hypothetical protein
MLYVSQLGMTRIIVEMDTTILSSALKANGINQSTIGDMVRQILDCMRNEISSCDVSVCNRSCNKVADCLAAFGRSVLAPGSELLLSQAPELNKLVSGDCHNAMYNVTRVWVVGCGSTAVRKFSFYL